MEEDDSMEKEEPPVAAAESMNVVAVPEQAPSNSSKQGSSSSSDGGGGTRGPAWKQRPWGNKKAEETPQQDDSSAPAAAPKVGGLGWLGRGRSKSTDEGRGRSKSADAAEEKVGWLGLVRSKSLDEAEEEGQQQPCEDPENEDLSTAFEDLSPRLDLGSRAAPHRHERHDQPGRPEPSRERGRNVDQRHLRLHASGRSRLNDSWPSVVYPEEIGRSVLHLAQVGACRCDDLVAIGRSLSIPPSADMSPGTRP